MKITLLTVGKTDTGYLKTGISDYAERLQHYTTFKISEIGTNKNRYSNNQDQIKEWEGDEILKTVKDSDELVLLDERGEVKSSEEFADFINIKMLNSTKCIVFVIGGAYGFSKKVYERANKKISLSAMTYSHQMVRLIFVEQLYRAFTIIKGEPYHHK